jgi:hypothetical protein
MDTWRRPLATAFPKIQQNFPCGQSFLSRIAYGREMPSPLRYSELKFDVTHRATTVVKAHTPKPLDGEYGDRGRLCITGPKYGVEDAV